MSSGFGHCFHDTSSKIQNDLIQSVTNAMTEAMREEVKNTPFVSVMVDETTDVSSTSQLSCVTPLLVVWRSAFSRVQGSWKTEVLFWIPRSLPHTKKTSPVLSFRALLKTTGCTYYMVNTTVIGVYCTWVVSGQAEGLHGISNVMKCQG